MPLSTGDTVSVDQSLFIQGPEFAKVASETSLSDDPNKWSEEILQALYKQVPYLADFDLAVAMSTVDGERGYGLGHVEVTSKSEAPSSTPAEQLEAAGIRKARIPAIVRDYKLLPLDIVITDVSGMLPLTEARLRQAMFRPQNFDVTSRTPGDQSMIGQLYPPYRQNYGFGGGGVAVSAGMGGKTASALEQFLTAPESTAEHSAKMACAPSALIEFQPADNSILTGVLERANITDLQDFAASLNGAVKVAFAHNVAAYESLEKIAGATPSTLEKRASALRRRMVHDVVQVSRNEGMYSVKTASHFAWAPEERLLSRSEVLGEFGQKVVLAADLTGAVTLAPEEGMSVDPQASPAAGPISAPGMYQVQDSEGNALTGVVIPNLYDIDGTQLPLSLFTDGRQVAVQGDMVGVPVGAAEPPGLMSAAQASGHGVFYAMHGGIPYATIPLSLGATLLGHDSNGVNHIQGETFDGRSVQVSVQPYAGTIMGIDGVMIVPDTWQWMPLDSAEDVTLAETPINTGKVAAAERLLSVVAGGPDSFALKGDPVAKLAAADLSFLTQDQAVFILTGLGLTPEFSQQKLASALASPERQAEVVVPRTLKLASDMESLSLEQAREFLANTPVLRQRMWKEASVVPDPTAVDAILSLGFINPENVATFVSYIPTLNSAQQKLCELLIGARLGLREVPEGALERAIRSLEDVIEGLNVIAFQG